MSTYVAMLRGINVSGHNLIKMEALRALFEACGFANVRTYIQSGNVVFTARAGAAACVTAIEKALARELRKPIAVALRTAQELGSIIRANPFAREKDADESKFAVTFLQAPPNKARLDALAGVQSGRDRFAARGKEIYLYLPDGFGRSKLAAGLERILSLPGTSRNWNTVKKLHEISITNVVGQAQLAR